MTLTAARLALTPPGSIDATLDLPGSKSLTNRALLIAALADGSSWIDGALAAEDATVMADALRRLGAGVTREGDAPGGNARLRVDGTGGRWRPGPLELDVQLSGTAVRFLTAAVTLGRGRYRLDGTARMRERPIQDQLDALVALGAAARSEAGSGCPPVLVEADGLPGGRAEVAGGLSSQYLSALLMTAPYARTAVELEVRGELQSKPFVDLTIRVMHAFGVEVERDGYRRFRVAPGRYAARRYQVEGDAMAAGYFWAAAAVSGGRVITRGVGRASVQGDAAFVRILERLGCTVAQQGAETRVTGPAGGRLRGGAFDLNDMPDHAQTLAVLALFADAPVRIDNVPNLRIKETDRLAALHRELARFGAVVEERPDGLTITPPTGAPPGAVVATYGDHRMAMAFAIAGLRWPGVVIDDPGCVAKTYPRFWDDLAASGVGVRAA
jgi:3-phosphoshikimate 1-carboxyvinyltransferase